MCTWRHSLKADTMQDMMQLKPWLKQVGEGVDSS